MAPKHIRQHVLGVGPTRTTKNVRTPILTKIDRAIARSFTANMFSLFPDAFDNFVVHEILADGVSVEMNGTSEPMEFVPFTATRDVTVVVERISDNDVLFSGTFIGTITAATEPAN